MHDSTRKIGTAWLVRYLPLALGLLVVLGLYLLPQGTPGAGRQPANPAANSTAAYAGINLNLSDVISASGTVNYTTLEVNNLTVLSPVFQESGYRYISVSEFNATSISINSTYPKTISSSIFVMDGSAAADQTQSRLIQANEQFNTSGHLESNLSNFSYSYKGKYVAIHRVDSLAAFNSIAVTLAGNFPIVESVSSFAYGNMVGFATINGYPNQDKNISVRLDELLFRHILDSRA